MARTNRGRNFSTLLRKITTKPLERELGFGKYVTTQARLMNPDGSFNVERQSDNWLDSTYYHLVTMSWRRFFFLLVCFFLMVNTLFSLLYAGIGVEQFNGITPGSPAHNITQAFFFSSQTLTTVGYGHISPNGLAASVLASFESFLGLLVFALMTGLLYGRFSRPGARVHFSPNLLVAPYRGGRGLMFRMGNASKSELLEPEVQVLMAYNQREDDGSLSRKFYPLALEINKINFFPLSWTVVHSMDENSPIYNFSIEDLSDANAEFMVLLKGTDEIAQQQVHTRRSYMAEDIVWNARFKPIIEMNETGVPRALTHHIGMYELVEE